MLAGLARAVRRSGPTSGRPNASGQPPSGRSSESGDYAVSAAEPETSMPSLASAGSPLFAGAAAAVRKSRRPSSGSSSAPSLHPARSPTPEKGPPPPAEGRGPGKNVVGQLQLAPLRAPTPERKTRSGEPELAPLWSPPSADRKRPPPSSVPLEAGASMGSPLPAGARGAAEKGGSPLQLGSPLTSVVGAQKQAWSGSYPAPLPPKPPSTPLPGTGATPPPLPQLPRKTLEASRSMGALPSRSPESSPAESQSASPGTTPRTPRLLEVSVEGQEATVGAGVWAADGSLEAPAGEARCTVTVKAGLRSGMSVVLRVGLAADDRSVAFARSEEAFGSWATTTVRGAEECDLGRLPMKNSGCSPRIPKPGACQHSWSQPVESVSIDLRCGAKVSAREALALETSACQADFFCRLTLRVHVTCELRESGQATLRVEVEGELGLMPSFCLVGQAAVSNFYKAARTSYIAGDDMKAIRTCERALTIASATKPRPKETGDTMNLLGALHLRRKTPGLAVKCLEAALTIRMGQTTGDATGSAALASTLTTLGSAHQANGSYAEAHSCHERAVAVLERIEGVDGSVLAAALHSLGGTHRALGNPEEARLCYEKALKLREARLGKGHAANATTQNNLGAVLQQLARPREAVGCYQKALAIQMKVYGREHVAGAATLSNLGSAHTQLGEHKVAVACHVRALGLQEQHVGPEHADVAATLHNLGNALASMGQGAEAVRCLWRALCIWSQTVGPAHPDIAATLHSLGNVYRGLKQQEPAAQCFAGALRIREVTLGPTHSQTARTRHCAALVGCSLGDEMSAAQELQAAVNSLIKGLGSRHAWTLQARADLESLKKAMSTPRSTWASTPRSEWTATPRSEISATPRPTTQGAEAASRIVAAAAAQVQVALRAS
mmetsp:Transcript_25469/g.85211  ORF Transcript_25469/g.85211 Transcript_25469/m.85211 type:complete len:899 (+) Transcript_25469:71-2767(+)